MAESKCSWVKKDNGTVEDSDNDLMWVLRDSRQELGKWLNWDEGHAYVKACNEQNYLGFNDWRLPTKSEVRSLFRNQDEYRDVFLNLPKKNLHVVFPITKQGVKPAFGLLRLAMTLMPGRAISLI